MLQFAESSSFHCNYCNSQGPGGITINMMTKRTKEELEGQIHKCYDEAGNNITNRWPAMSYEDGVVNTIDWIIGRVDEPPMEDE